MANIFQKIFLPTYQWKILDMVKKYDIKEDRHESVDSLVYTYSITTDDTDIRAERRFDKNSAPFAKYNLYLNRKRKEGDIRNPSWEERNTHFACHLFHIMRRRFFDKNLAAKQFSW